MSSIIRAVINALLPPGFAWRPEPEEGLDQFFDGVSDSIENDGLTVANSLADIRNPKKTSIFEDLERNYGIRPNSTISEADRVSRLERKVYQGEKVNSIDDVQSELIIAGFDLQVHKNDPPVDPALFLTQSFQITAGSDFAYAGYNNGVDILAFAASLGGELLVNTIVTKQFPAYEMQAGGDFGYAGFTSDGIKYESTAGYFTGLRAEILEYPIPVSSDYWSMIWFVGADATRDPVTGELLTIAPGLVPLNRKDELISLLLADKTIGSWVGMIIQFT
jgi:hypothetical protein